MSPDWHAALLAVLHHPLFGVGITLAVYQGALAAYERTRWMFLQPVLVSMAVLIGILLLAGLSYQEYRESTFLLSVLLGPATVALAVPLFLNLKRIRQLFWPTLITLLLAGLLATVLGVALAWAFGAERMMLMTMAPKSVTSPIAMLVAEQIGGVAALAAVFVLITGVLGAMCGRSCCAVSVCTIRRRRAWRWASLRMRWVPPARCRRARRAAPSRPWP